jgi:hypothetical protein
VVRVVLVLALVVALAGMALAASVVVFMGRDVADAGLVLTEDFSSESGSFDVTDGRVVDGSYALTSMDPGMLSMTFASIRPARVVDLGADFVLEESADSGDYALLMVSNPDSGYGYAFALSRAREAMVFRQDDPELGWEPVAWGAQVPDRPSGRARMTVSWRLDGKHIVGYVDGTEVVSYVDDAAMPGFAFTAVGLGVAGDPPPAAAQFDNVSVSTVRSPVACRIGDDAVNCWTGPL